MSNLREAAQQALEALLKSVDLVRNEYSTDWRHGMPTRAEQLNGKRETLEAHEAAITALRAALEQPQREPLTDEQVWANEEIMASNADARLLMVTLMRFVRAIERAHGIEAPKDAA
jgi:hypothetical protein